MTFTRQQQHHRHSQHHSKYQGNRSVVGLYMDVFMVYDEDEGNWCLARIIVP
eukprot:gnl/Chilomastix_caulleri/5497.p3 GENE.gnl/Chilomastix_caulleri/5497~~gnl/Chilomastix_caulleri/5497.p3  ORF type:complete len:52 (+),score=10.45 gnl/Chilomastix_caulleri/5497:108-263(+)